MNNNKQNKMVNTRGRWLGIAISSIFAILSWYCLLNDLDGAAVFSVIAIVLLFLFLFVPDLLAFPVRILQTGLGMLLNAVLFSCYFLVLLPYGLFITVLDSDYLWEEQIHRNRKYRNKIIGTYWIYK